MSRIVVKVRRFGDRPALQLQWIDADGRRRTQSARTADEAEAEQARGDLEYRLNHGLHVEAVRTGWETFREAFEAEYLSGCRENTRNGYAATFAHFEAICSPATLSGITARTLSQFVAGLRKLPGRSGKGYMASTIALRLEHLSAALAWAVHVKMLAEVPAFPEVSVPKKRPQPVPVEWVTVLLAACEDLELRAYILCGWLAGMRRNEAYHLSWDSSDDAPWLDLGRRRIVFPAASVKADEDQWVPLDVQLQAALLALPSRSGPVFRFRLSPMSTAERIERLARRLGLRLTMRILRRGFACRYASKVSAQVLQRLCRHADISTTLSYYASFEDAIERAVFGNTEPPSVTESLAFPGVSEDNLTSHGTEEGQTDREAA